MFARGFLTSLSAALLLVFLGTDFVVAGQPAKRFKRRNPGSPNVGAVARARQAQATESVESQIAAARRALAAAESRAAAASSTISSANQRISQAREEIDTAKTDIRDGREELRTIENDIITQADESSALQRAVSAVETARANLQRAELRVLESSAYRERVAALDADNDDPNKLAELRSSALAKDARYQQALFDWDVASEQFNNLRGEKIYQDPAWKQTSESLRDAKLSHNRATEQAAAGGMQKLPAGAQLRKAQSAANEARQAIAAGEAWLKQYGVKKQPTRSAGDKKK